ncbi:RrF2 family transcriptional regulator [Bryobacter aggregatus]|uniref:RrF2 family transcriptional regulator n=1 Tax=Bryobacter aggregatus TaxID=360054 RepID=UPI0004E142F2|nr:Rrf2 family transcriptional regulator [Bryobacter aggregatus]
MRSLSKRTQYSLRALYALARRGVGKPALIGDLSRDEEIPKKFLEQILLSLKQKGLVDSRRGRYGGYVLAVQPEKISVGSIIRMIDGPLAPLPCASEHSFRKCDECPDIRFCGTRIVMRQVRDATADILDRTTLADVCRKVDAAKVEAEEGEGLMYYI